MEGLPMGREVEIITATISIVVVAVVVIVVRRRSSMKQTQKRILTHFPVFLLIPP
jgi:Flp pilus assembly protein TadB